MEIFDDSLTRVRHDKVERNKNKEAQRLEKMKRINNNNLSLVSSAKYVSTIEAQLYKKRKKNKRTRNLFPMIHFQESVRERAYKCDANISVWTRWRKGERSRHETSFYRGSDESHASNN